MNFLRKKKKDIEDDNNSKPIKKVKPKNSNVFDFERMTADVEKLKGGMEANSELRQVYSEKFSRFDETIGELRNMLIDREKDISRIELASTKAADMVAEVQPEALMTEVKKSNAQIESTKDKLESYHDLMNALMEQIKDLQRVVKTFRGIDDVRGMLKDIHKDITSYEKIKDVVESHADKLENTYSSFLKKYDELKAFKEAFKETNQRISSYENEFEKINEANKSLVTKTEFDNFSKKMSDFISFFEQKFDDIHSNFFTKLNDIEKLEKNLKDMEGKLSLNEREINKFEEMAEKIVKKSELNNRLSPIENSIKHIQNIKLGKTLDVIKKISMNNSKSINETDKTLKKTVNEQNKLIKSLLTRINKLESKVNKEHDRETNTIKRVNGFNEIIKKIIKRKK